MKRTRKAVLGILAAVTLLSGCGMVEDGYIRDTPAPTTAPVQSPYLPVSPIPTLRPETDHGTDEDVTDTPEGGVNDRTESSANPKN